MQVSEIPFFPPENGLNNNLIVFVILNLLRCITDFSMEHDRLLIIPNQEALSLGNCWRINK